MTLAIELSPDIEARLHERAAEAGVEPATIAALLLGDALLADDVYAGDGDLSPDDLRRMHEGIERGLADVAAGRVVPLEDYIAQQRSKHGHAAEWPADKP